MASRVAAANAGAEALLARMGLEGALVTAISGGANSRVFKVAHASGRFLLKSYFRGDGDSRERLGVEFGFAAFLWERGLRQLARPVASDPDSLLALYGFIDGRACRKDDVDAEAVRQAAVFFREANAWRGAAEAERLPRAREGCFTEADHLGLVERRLARLRAVKPASAVDREAGSFVAEGIAPLYSELRAALGAPTEPLPDPELCLSPSDFGFHNARREQGGGFRFFDFEYAGWDDPAKMIADFFSQPALPVPERHWDLFCREALAGFPVDSIEARARRMLPVQRLKWVCLMLNDFLPTVDDRRRFALVGEEPSERKARQLAKARSALRHLKDGTWPT